MSSKLPDGFSFNDQGLVVTSIENLDKLLTERERLAKIKELKRFHFPETGAFIEDTVKDRIATLNKEKK